MKFINLFILIAICFSACGGGSGAAQTRSQGFDPCEFIATSQSTSKIANGTVCQQSTSSAVLGVAANLQRSTSDLPRMHCTASYIGSKTVLTAAHCLTLKGVESRDYVVIASPSASPERYQVEEIFFPPSLSVLNGQVIDDVAIIKIAEQPEINTVVLAESHELVSGDEAFIFGYGRTESLTISDSDFLRAGRVIVETTGPDHIKTFPFDGSFSNACPGDSGGPLVIEKDGLPTIAGVISQGTQRSCGTGDSLSITNLAKPALKEWIKAVAPDAIYS